MCVCGVVWCGVVCSSISNRRREPSEVDKAVLSLKTQRRKLGEYQRQVQNKVVNAHQQAQACIRQKNKAKAVFNLKQKKIFEIRLGEIEQYLINVEETVSQKPWFSPSFLPSSLHEGGYQPLLVVRNRSTHSHFFSSPTTTLQLCNIDTAKQNNKVFEALKSGNAALKTIQAKVSISALQDLVADTEAAKEHEVSVMIRFVFVSIKAFSSSLPFLLNELLTYSFVFYPQETVNSILANENVDMADLENELSMLEDEIITEETVEQLPKVPKEPLPEIKSEKVEQVSAPEAKAQHAGQEQPMLAS